MNTTPRFIKPGPTQVFSTSSAFIGAVALSSKSGAASLSIWASASTTFNITLTNRLYISVNPASGPRTVAFDLGGSLWPTGVTVSCSGSGALGVVFMNNRTRA